MQQNNSTQAVPLQSVPEIRIISKLSLSSPSIERKPDPDPEVSVLPLESIKLTPRTRRSALSDAKYMHLSKSKSPNPSRITSAKQLVFRGKGVRLTSEEKERKLEETVMMQRQRRLNRVQIEKKIQGLVSPHLRDQYHLQQLKKFKRSEEKRLLTENKKFKRIKEKPNEQQIAIREKIMKKIMDDPRNFLSGIAEKSEDLYVSQLDLGGPKGVSVFQQAISESVQESQILS